MAESDQDIPGCLLSELPVGARLLVRCKSDWRIAAVSARHDERIVLTIASPTGRSYRRSCPAETTVLMDGRLPVIGDGIWRDEFARYDVRW